jgi:hypothetical protein
MVRAPHSALYMEAQTTCAGDVTFLPQQLFLNASLRSTTADCHCRTTIMATGVDARLLKSTKFPAEFSQKVDMQKVNLQVMKK